MGTLPLFQLAVGTRRRRTRNRGNVPIFLVALFATVVGSTGSEAVIADKTLVAWVSLANLTQGGGSVLTLENPGGEFDAIVFGEREPAKWMAGRCMTVKESTLGTSNGQRTVIPSPCPCK